MFYSVGRHKTTSRFVAGFTLIELIIVVGIFVLLTGILLVRLPSLGTKTRVDAATNVLIQTVRKMYNDSISVRELEPGLFPSYGIFLDTNFPRRIIVYADCIADDNSDGIIDDRDLFTYRESSTDCNGKNGFVEEITLDSRVRIQEIRSILSRSLNIPTVETEVHIEFLRPEPSVWMTNESGVVLPTGRVEIDITDIGGQFTKTIIIWISGKIEILD